MQRAVERACGRNTAERASSLLLFLSSLLYYIIWYAGLYRTREGANHVWWRTEWSYKARGSIKNGERINIRQQSAIFKPGQKKKIGCGWRRRSLTHNFIPINRRHLLQTRKNPIEKDLFSITGKNLINIRLMDICVLKRNYKRRLRVCHISTTSL